LTESETETECSQEVVSEVFANKLLKNNCILLSLREPQLELYNYDREVNSFEVWEQYVSAECTDTHISFGIAPDTEVLKGYFKERAELIFNPGRTNASARCSTNASDASQIQFSVLREECELPQDNQCSQSERRTPEAAGIRGSRSLVTCEVSSHQSRQRGIQISGSPDKSSRTLTLNSGLEIGGIDFRGRERFCIRR
uniref:ZP domain-containing protein n=1 Tax=Ascaris lumbricoides TaxID=6252 RepID=A0A0M3I3V4_ASCLU